ncbi:MAG: UDP-N-acetylmuramoyl-tripeptide--D-alanyl-D-alanine ligase [Chloroflexota bacterium]|nr:UDP-N-acetylmuramoyl-tripeptide--D-alanyl-D-alanine ligase [Chloroflexota bacterium]
MFTLADVATAAEQPVPHGADDLAMAAAHFDSRRIQPGMLFVALPGARVDGHDFIGDAFARGAGAVLCARPDLDQPMGRQVVTAEPQAAFERLASALRARSSATFVGVTGSNGKTTTKEALAAALSAAGPTLATERSENAEVGVPATLSRLTPAHRYAVVEIGAQVVGEISHYCSYAKPDVGVITSIAGAHLGLFGSMEAIATAKGELFEALPEHGPAIVNADDPWSDELRRRAPGPVVSFGRSDAADVRVSATLLADPPGTRVHIEAGSFCDSVDVPGTAGAIDLAFGAAFAATQALGVDPATACDGLRAFQPAPHRMRLEALPGGGLLLDDSYNANASSMAVALDTLRAVSVPGRRIAVLGDMFELGSYGPAAHQQVGRDAAGIDRLLCVGALAAQIASGARAAGLEAVDVISADTEDSGSIATAVDAAAAWLHAELAAGDAVLLKASNGMGFARLVDKVMEAPRRSAG